MCVLEDTDLVCVINVLSCLFKNPPTDDLTEGLDCLLLSSDDDDRCHLVVLAHRIVEEDEAYCRFVDGHRF